MREIMQGEATDAQIASYITALRMKGETVEEITGSARVMREKAVPIKLDANIMLIPAARARYGAYVQYFHDGRLRGCRRGCCRCQAREPFRLKQERKRRCAQALGSTSSSPRIALKSA